LLLSLVIPVYRNEANLDRLLVELRALEPRLPGPVEVVFVVDGSPDRSYDILRERLPALGMRARLVSLSRNFGAFAAVTAGLASGAGDFFAVLAADLQEPPELIVRFYEALLAGQTDIVFGVREQRSGAFVSKLFWKLYRRFVIPDMPKGGVDVFACTREVRDHVLDFHEASSSLIALLFWLGFRRGFVGYERAERREGSSAWTLSKKITYGFEIVFNFTDLPIRLLLASGAIGCGFAVIFAVILLIAKLQGRIAVPGYTPVVLSIMFFGGLTALGLGILGEYQWLSLQNVRRRPRYVVASSEEFMAGDAPSADRHIRRGSGRELP